VQPTLLRLCVELDKLRHHPRIGDGTGPRGGTGSDGTGSDAGQGAPAPDTARAWEALERAIIGKTTILLLHSCSALDVR